MKREPAELDALVGEALRQVGPATAYALAAWLRERGEGMPEVQVYRVLARLMARGEARHVQLGRRYVTARPGDSPVLPLACRGCGSLRLVEARAIDARLRAIATSRGFAADDVIVEVGGLCSQCADGSLESGQGIALPVC